MLGKVAEKWRSIALLSMEHFSLTPLRCYLIFKFLVFRVFCPETFLFISRTYCTSAKFLNNNRYRIKSNLE